MFGNHRFRFDRTHHTGSGKCNRWDPAHRRLFQNGGKGKAGCGRIRGRPGLYGSGCISGG